MRLISDRSPAEGKAGRPDAPAEPRSAVGPGPRARAPGREEALPPFAEREPGRGALTEVDALPAAPDRAPNRTPVAAPERPPADAPGRTPAAAPDRAPAAAPGRTPAAGTLPPSRTPAGVDRPPGAGVEDLPPVRVPAAAVRAAAAETAALPLDGAPAAPVREPAAETGALRRDGAVAVLPPAVPPGALTAAVLPRVEREAALLAPALFPGLSA